MYFKIKNNINQAKLTFEAIYVIFFLLALQNKCTERRNINVLASKYKRVLILYKYSEKLFNRKSFYS